MIVDAPVVDTALRMVVDGADQTVWLVPTRAEPRLGVKDTALLIMDSALKWENPLKFL